ncbi:MAG: hypothetical protein DI636_03985 [Pelagerythrobacter marensis]|uniref:OmpH family outer membrane protein n=1 Tax=Qipengyuania sp. YIM B01966 TaxID=2778646 RepID=UPI000DB77AD7|nr:OmpH family outer membrane protein [Qipengyuania sp. YIM B01966]PZO71419.1 MAG: hypothetical protein DI636_03985 [Pelagerythrobacter marensis]
MKKIVASALAAGLAMGAVPALTVPAAAQVVRGIGVVNLPAIVANSNAYRTAEQQRQVTYKPQLDQAEARRAQIAAQLQPLITRFNTDRQAANPNQQSLQQQAQQIQTIEQNGQRELQQMLAPLALSRAYVQEQIEDKLEAAVQAAARRKNITLILDPNSGAVIYADQAYNLTQDVLNEVNTALPAAQLVPPQGWVPREIRQQQEAAAAAQAAQAGQPAAQPQQPAQPTGR